MWLPRSPSGPSSWRRAGCCSTGRSEIWWNATTWPEPSSWASKGADVLLASAWVTKQVVFDGLVNGLVIGLLAIGIVLIYRATRVINFAVGNMGLVAAGLLALMDVQYRVPFWISLV